MSGVMPNPMKPHFYKKYGYWNCRMEDYRGAGDTRKQALESLLKHKRFILRLHAEIGF